LWKQASLYDSADDSDYRLSTKQKQTNANGELSLADAMELDYSLPDEIPSYFQNILAKYTHANKTSRRSYSFKQKLALLNWIDFHKGADEKHNGWEQAFNNNDTSVLHQTLRDIVDNNIVRGFQRRAAPEEVGPHNYFTELAKKYLQVSSNVDSDDEHDDVLEELDDFDFYRLQQQDENIEPNACTAGLPVDNVNFSDSSETDSELPQAENSDDGNSDGQQESERSAPEDGEESELEF